MEEGTQNLTPKLDSIEFQNQEVEPRLQADSPMPSLADPDTTDLSNDSVISEGEKHEDITPSKSQQCCKKDSSTYQELKNQARELQDEIFKSLNQNLELKKRFWLAKSVLKRDMGVGCLEELVREREEEGWCGSKDMEAALRKKLHSLKNQVRVKREESKEEGCSIPFKCPLPDDERIQGLVFMEREYMIHNVRREEHKWVEDRDRLAKKLEFFVERNKRLEAEASSIRSDLSMEPEALEVVSVARFLAVQRRMDLCLEKKFKLKSSLLAAEASVRANEAEIERLKTEIGRQEALLAESETALRMMAEGVEEDRGEDLVKELRIERQATSRMFREGLGELLATYSVLLERAESSSGDGGRCSKNVESVLMRDDAESQLVAEIRRRRNSGKGDEGFPKLVQLHCPVEPLQALESLSLSSSEEQHDEEGIEGSTESVQREEKDTDYVNLESSASSSSLELVKQEEKATEANLEPSTSPSTAEPSVQCEEKVDEVNLEPSASPFTLEPVQQKENLESCLPETEKECRDAMRDLLSNMIGDFELSTFNAQSLGEGEVHHLVQCLEEELLELSSNFAKRKRELRKRHWRLQVVFDRLKSEANQLLDARGQLSKESATVRILSNRLKRMAQEVERKISMRAAVETFRFGDASEVEDSKALLHVLRSENACVKRLIRAACASVDEDVDKFLQLSAIKILF